MVKYGNRQGPRYADPVPDAGREAVIRSSREVSEHLAHMLLELADMLVHKLRGVLAAAT